MIGKSKLSSPGKIPLPFWPDTKVRSSLPEIMDDIHSTDKQFLTTLSEIERVNNHLGGNAILMDSVKRILKSNSQTGTIRFCDMGCGGGDGLRALSGWLAIHPYHFMLTGIDASEMILAHAKSQKGMVSIHYRVMDILSDDFEFDHYDIVHAGLFLHHLSSAEIDHLMERFAASKCRYFIINDLQRSRIAYFLFRLSAKIFRFSPMAKYDGAVSVLRGFKRNDFITLASRHLLKIMVLRWRWAFRFQVILKNRI